MPCDARLIRATFAFALLLSVTGPCVARTTRAFVFDRAYADQIRTINPAIAKRQSRAYADVLLVNAQRMNVDPRLVMAVVTVESHWDARAVSIHGAQGLGQLLPSTARELGVDPRSPRANIRGITVYLHQLLTLFKSSRQSMRDAIAGYNAGPYAVTSGVAPARRETRRYVVKVLAAWHAFVQRLGPNPRRAHVAAVLDAAEIAASNQTAYWGIR